MSRLGWKSTLTAFGVDVTPFISGEEAYRIFTLYQPDIVGYVRLFYALDVFWPLASASRRWFRYEGVGRMPSS